MCVRTEQWNTYLTVALPGRGCSTLPGTHRVVQHTGSETHNPAITDNRREGFIIVIIEKNIISVLISLSVKEMHQSAIQYELQIEPRYNEPLECEFSIVIEVPLYHGS